MIGVIIYEFVQFLLDLPYVVLTYTIAREYMNLWSSLVGWDEGLYQADKIVKTGIEGQ